MRVIATGSPYDTVLEAHGAGATNYSHTNGIFVVNGNTSIHTSIEGLTIAGGVKRGSAGTVAAGGAVSIGPRAPAMNTGSAASPAAANTNATARRPGSPARTQPA